jgi:hypothetical protein
MTGPIWLNTIKRRLSSSTVKKLRNERNRTSSDKTESRTSKSGRKSKSSSKGRKESIALSNQTGSGSGSDEVFDDSEITRQIAAIKDKYENVTDDDIEMYREMFNQFDINGDGTVQKNELREAMNNISKRDILESEIDAMFDQLDVDHDDQISFVEFARKF